MNVWLRRTPLLIAGGAAGFAYYYFVGCATGSCPITSNPYNSTGYGAMMGVLIGMGKSEKKT